MRILHTCNIIQKSYDDKHIHRSYTGTDRKKILEQIVKFKVFMKYTFMYALNAPILCRIHPR